MLLKIARVWFKVAWISWFWLAVTHLAAAQSLAPLEIDPPQTDIVIGSAPEERVLKCPQIGKRLRYQWSIEGPGTLEGDLTSPAIFYHSPTVLEQKLMIVTLRVTVTDADNYQTHYQSQLTLLDPKNHTTRQDFTLTLSTDKPRYQIGDSMTITAQSDQDCYLWLFHQDSQRRITSMFPNKYQTDNFIQGGQPLTFPDPHIESYEFKIAEPTGIESIIAIGRVADNNMEGAYSRGLEKIKLQKELSEAIIHYEIVEKTDTSISDVLD